MGALSDKSTYDKQAANQEYCVPGDTASCAAPVAEFKMDEKTGSTAFDTTDGASNYSLTNTTWSSSAKCHQGACLEFNGSSSVATKTDTTGSELDISTAITLEGWVYPRDCLGTGDGIQEILTKQTAYYLNIQNVTCKPEFYFYGLSSPGYHVANNAISLNRWSHIAATWDGSSVKLYINGILDRTVSSVTGTGTVNNDALFSGSNSGVRHLDGYLDNLKVFNYARTAAQIAWDYNRGGPIAQYKMDECSGANLNDASGNGNTGTIYPVTLGNTTTGTCASGTTTEMWNDGTTGKFNSSLGFDGSDDYVSAGNAPINISNVTTQPFSLSAWFYVNAFTGTSPATEKNAPILTIGTGDYNAFQFGSWTGKLTAYADTNGVTAWDFGAEPTIGTTSLSTGQWYHGVVTRNTAGLYSIYLNGKLDGSITNSNNLFLNNQTLKIGAHYGMNSSYMLNGQIDDVRIYNYALTANQVKNIMNEGSAVRFGPSTGSP